MAFIPIALQLLPLIPGMVEGLFKIVEVVRADPSTPAEAKAELDGLSERLAACVEKVKHAPLPTV